MNEHIDVIVPRGGKSLIERVQNESRIPVLAHLDGNCHVYLHASADPEMALAVTLNAKLRRTGICGAAETLLCDRRIAATLLPRCSMRSSPGVRDPRRQRGHGDRAARSKGDGAGLADRIS